ncbi:MAG: hypothetical protein LUE06_01535 [Oscillospiraceae bacterium]|nr:hypothetical protein [Oscillospiraceae bacterium]
MKMIDMTKAARTLAANKYVLLVLAAGLALLAWPSAAEGADTGGGDALAATGTALTTEAERLADFLENTEGVGKAQVLLSSEGAVVVCDGADSAAVRYAVTGAVGAYTGLGSDKITIIKMK